MGAAQSTQTPPSEQVIRPQGDATVQFAPTLIEQLAHPTSKDESSSSQVPAHSHHDQAIMSRLQQETARLRHEEAQILSAISAALEKENLDKEKPGMSSELLSRDIEEIKEKITRMTEKRKDILEGEGDKAGVRQAREDVVKCYRNNKDRPLDCWREVETFKQTVGKLEQDFVASLR